MLQRPLIQFFVLMAAGRVRQRFLAWDDFLGLGLCGGCSAGVYPRRILAGAANGRRA